MPFDAIVVGAGPTGLALGLELRRHGMEPLLLDRLEEGRNTSRAAVVHARTLEVLEPSGVSAKLLAEGLIVPTFRIRDRDRVLLSIPFEGLHTRYPFTLMCPQNQTEAILLRRFQASGGRVQRPCEVVRVSDAGGEAAVEFRCDGKATETATARWVVGCDGGHSVVRSEAGIGFPGAGYPESFVLADVEMHWPVHRDEVSLFMSDRGLMVVAPLPENRFRIVATAETAPEEPSREFLQALVDERGPEEERAEIRRLVWSSRFHIEHRIARTLRNGRLLLAGDAAHVHSPAGGQGMNTGIQDAVSLAAVLKHYKDTGDEAAVDSWVKTRLEIAQTVVSLTDRMTKLATLSSPAGRLLRNAVIGLAGYSSAARHALAEKLAELGNR